MENTFIIFVVNTLVMLSIVMFINKDKKIAIVCLLISISVIAIYKINHFSKQQVVVEKKYITNQEKINNILNNK